MALGVCPVLPGTQEPLIRSNPSERRIWIGGRAFTGAAIKALLVAAGLFELGIARAGLFYNSIFSMFLLEVGGRPPPYPELTHPFLLEEHFSCDLILRC